MDVGASKFDPMDLDAWLDAASATDSRLYGKFSYAQSSGSLPFLSQEPENFLVHIAGHRHRR